MLRIRFRVWDVFTSNGRILAAQHSLFCRSAMSALPFHIVRQYRSNYSSFTVAKKLGSQSGLALP